MQQVAGAADAHRQGRAAHGWATTARHVCVCLWPQLLCSLCRALLRCASNTAVPLRPAPAACSPRRPPSCLSPPPADRGLRFFAREKSQAHNMLREMLLTYERYNQDLGYVQGQSDLAAPCL